MMKRFKDKVALVTGGRTGMGRAGALRLAAEGATVVVAGRRSAELEATASLAMSLDGEIRPIVADVTDAEQTERLISRISADHGGLDLAWNNAGALGDE